MSTKTVGQFILSVGRAPTLEEFQSMSLTFEDDTCFPTVVSKWDRFVLLFRQRPSAEDIARLGLNDPNSPAYRPLAMQEPPLFELTPPLPPRPRARKTRR